MRDPYDMDNRNNATLVYAKTHEAILDESIKVRGENRTPLLNERREKEVIAIGLSRFGEAIKRQESPTHSER